MAGLKDTNLFEEEKLPSFQVLNYSEFIKKIIDQSAVWQFIDVL